jgi:hypothetical protein
MAEIDEPINGADQHTRHIMDNAGASTRSEIMTIVVTGAASEHYAIDVAKQQFERSRHVLNWTFLATDLDIQEVNLSRPAGPN